MAKVNAGTSGSINKRRKAINPETREQQLIDLATNLAEQQLLQGTASSQVITHYLKLGTVKAQYEVEKLKRENQLMEAKTKQITSSEEMKSMVEKAIKAMKKYQGNGDPDDYEY